VDTSIFVPRTELPPVPTFVCVASICLRKGHQYLFRAFEQLKQKLPAARLICVGGVRPDFKREWKRWEGSFEHQPSLSHAEVSKLLTSATAFILPSVEEGFARVLSEAMACALPVIATYETGATTVIQDGEQGFIVPARNIAALTEAMLTAANNDELNLEMGRKALLAGGTSNTWADYAKRLHDEYVNRLKSL
jgi:glycosyltransferase involved in cell wall biosynthesis